MSSIQRRLNVANHCITKLMEMKYARYLFPANADWIVNCNHKRSASSHTTEKERGCRQFHRGIIVDLPPQRFDIFTLWLKHRLFPQIFLTQLPYPTRIVFGYTISCRRILPRWLLFNGWLQVSFWRFNRQIFFIISCIITQNSLCLEWGSMEGGGPSLLIHA